jgi:hypothetical protein
VTRLADPAVERLLEASRIHEEPDWEDVLERARERGSRRPTRQTVFGVGRRRILVALACVLAVAAVPPAAYVARDWLDSQPVRATMTNVHVEIAGTRHASFALRSFGTGLKRGQSGFEFEGADHSKTRQFSWTLELSSGFAGEQAEIDLGARRIILCQPCAKRNRGTFVIDRLGAVRLLNGRASLHVGSTSRRIGPSAGGRLGVVPRQVVQSRRGRLVAEAAVSSSVVVVEEPVWEC